MTRHRKGLVRPRAHFHLPPRRPRRVEVDMHFDEEEVRALVRKVLPDVLEELGAADERWMDE